ncbi:MAG: hypothetical protein NZ889_01535 [Candidatus Pacearchaeota archaeon]|nr:hypothetical protein [Candidatus Pacearchaeota archaeon]
MQNKKAQLMGMPFQLVFSLLLVVAVIVFSFFAIRMFLQRAEQAKFGSTFIEIQRKIEEAWSRAGESNETFVVSAPKEVEAICFLNRSATCRNPQGISFCQEFLMFAQEKDNFFFYPFGIAEKYGSKTAWKLLCEEKPCVNIPIRKNPTCFFVDENKEIKFRIIKKFEEALVILENE